MPRQDRIVVEANANSWFGSEQFELTPGVIDETAEHVFTRGQCHALALAIHDETGWPIVGIAGDGNHHPGHCAIERPDGRIIDITGYAEYAWIGRGYSDWFPVDPEAARAGFPVDEYDPGIQEWDDMWGDEFPDERPDTYYRMPDMDAARSFVRPVLERTGSVASSQPALIT